jgi:DNA-binding NtrC family response regulator
VEPHKQRLVIVGSVPWGEEVVALFRRAGWDIFHLTNSSDLACAIISRRPHVVVLPLQTADESGFLIAAKVKQARPKTRVLLIGTEADPLAARFAQFVGALFLSGDQGLFALVREICR